MTTLSLTAGVPARDRLEYASLGGLVGVVAALQLSIAIAHILLAITIVCWLASHIQRHQRLEAPEFFWPLVVYGGLTLLSAGFSLDPRVSFADSKQLVLLLLVPVVYDLARGTRAALILTIILSVGAASALIGIVQYGILNFDDLRRRPQGALSHWMTYSGTLMLVVCAAVSRLLFDTKGRIWAAVIMPALIVSLMVTLTRTAMVGVAVGVGALLLSRDFRLLAVLPILAAIVIALAPASVTNRVYSIIDLNDPTRRDRLAMLQAGVSMIQDHPLTGVGPNEIERVYPVYRVPGAVQASNPHLHNVPIQIAAERGLPALGAWLWFVITAGAGLIKLLRRSRHRTLAAAGLGSLVAALSAGLFEYNFGDSEFLMLLLTMITLPFAANRDGGLPR
ncbi:MAG: O-antigen ligase family protein [Vicinamibacterales bacterium]